MRSPAPHGWGSWPSVDQPRDYPQTTNDHEHKGQQHEIMPSRPFANGTCFLDKFSTSH